MPPVEIVPWWWAPLLSTVLGAISGGIAGLVVGPTKAEREERGRLRIDARRGVALALRAFRYALTEYRQALLFIEGEAKFETVQDKALMLAKVVQDDAASLPRRERRRLLKRIRKLVGPELLQVALLRAPDSEYVVADSASLLATARFRQRLDDDVLFTDRLKNLPPTAKDWDKVISSIDTLRAKYP